MKTSLWFCLALFAAAVEPAGAQLHPWFLQNRGYFDPTMAEPRAAQTQVMFPALSDSFQYAVNPGRGLVWDISVGHEIPVLGWETNRSTGPSGVPPGAFGFGLWFPLSFHMIEDMGKDPSNPILNTDYRFSGMLKAQYGLPEHWAGTSRSHIGVKFQFGHESTHIGDEFTINALRLYGTQFLRVNVSYEYFDLGGSFEPNFGRQRWKIHAGNIWLWKPDKGWYSRELLQPFGLFIAGSNRNHEPYGGVEFFLEPKNGTGLGFIASADIRNRTIYQYNIVPTIAFTNEPEPTEVSVNLMAGARQVRQAPGFLGKIQPTYYLRYYHGVNPNGQFRDQAHFTLFGFGVLFGF